MFQSGGTSSVRRALSILDYLAHHPGEHGVRSLAASLEITPSTAFRLLDAMHELGFVRQDPATERYSIGLKAVQLGLSALGGLDITSVAPGRLRVLVEETGESAFVAVLDDTEIVYLLKAEGQRAIRTTAVLGSRRPTHCTALGKSLLAALPPEQASQLLSRAGLPRMTSHTITDLERLREELAYVRAQGYAVDRQEVEEGLMCVAAVIRDHLGRPAAALSVAGPIERIQPSEERFARRVMAAALEISTALGYVPPWSAARTPSLTS